MDDGPLEEPCDREGKRAVPISRQRRRELLGLADQIAARFDEITDPREHRLLRRMVEQLVKDY